MKTSCKLHQIEHWKWISFYYMCSLGEFFEVHCLLVIFWKSETIISAKENVKKLILNELKDDEYLILEALKVNLRLQFKMIKILGKENGFPNHQSIV